MPIKLRPYKTDPQHTRNNICIQWFYALIFHPIKDHFIHRFGINQKLLPFTFFGFENYVLYQGLQTSSCIFRIDFPQ